MYVRALRCANVLINTRVNVRRGCRSSRIYNVAWLRRTVSADARCTVRKKRISRGTSPLALFVPLRDRIFNVIGAVFGQPDDLEASIVLTREGEREKCNMIAIAVISVSNRRKTVSNIERTERSMNTFDVNIN